MSQPRSSSAVFIALALIVASIAVFAYGAKQMQGSPSLPPGTHGGVTVLLFASLILGIYFIARLGASGFLIVIGRPITRRVAWLTAGGAQLHGAVVLTLTLAAALLAPSQPLLPEVAALALAEMALFVMGHYANLCETQGWTVREAVREAVRETPRRAPVAPVARVVPVASVAPPVPVETPRGDQPSLLR